MPRVRAETAQAHQAGAYCFLVDREEAEYRDWSASVHGRNGGYPRRRRLDALRAGQPVTVSLCELPVGARPAGMLPRPRTAAEVTDEYRRQHETLWTVYVDDRVVRRALDGAPTPLDEYLDL